MNHFNMVEICISFFNVSVISSIILNSRRYYRDYSKSGNVNRRTIQRVAKKTQFCVYRITDNFDT